MKASEENPALRWFAILARLVVGAVFLYAGLAKVLDPQAFSAQIAAYRLTPEMLTNVLAAFLPVLEIVCGLCLVAGRWVLGASALAMTLLAAFLFAIASALVRGLDIDCGCFSVSGGHRVSLWRLLEDAVLFLLALFSFHSARRKEVSVATTSRHLHSTTRRS